MAVLNLADRSGWRLTNCRLMGIWRKLGDEPRPGGRRSSKSLHCLALIA